MPSSIAHVHLDDADNTGWPFYIGALDLSAVRIKHDGRTYHLVADDEPDDLDEFIDEQRADAKFAAAYDNLRAGDDLDRLAVNLIDAINKFNAAVRARHAAGDAHTSTATPDPALIANLDATIDHLFPDDDG